MTWRAIAPWNRLLPMDAYGRWIVRDPLGPDTGYSPRTMLQVRGRLVPADRQAVELERLKAEGANVVFVWTCHIDHCKAPVPAIPETKSRRRQGGADARAKRHESVDAGRAAVPQTQLSLFGT